MMLIPQELEGFDVRDAVARMLDRPELWWQAVGFFVHHFSGWEADWLEVRVTIKPSVAVYMRFAVQRQMSVRCVLRPWLSAWKISCCGGSPARM